MDARDARRAGVAETRSPDAREVASSTRGAVCRAGRSRGRRLATTAVRVAIEDTRSSKAHSSQIPRTIGRCDFNGSFPRGGARGGVSRDEPVPHTQPSRTPHPRVLPLVT